MSVPTVLSCCWLFPSACDLLCSSSFTTCRLLGISASLALMIESAVNSSGMTYTVPNAATSGLATTANTEKPQLRFQRASSILLTTPPEPFFPVGVDLLGTFPLSSSGNKWIAVATDYATHYAITRALPTSCATDVADFMLRDIILQHGAPRQLLTDRGRYFLSQVIHDILHSCSVKHKLSTAYHPKPTALRDASIAP